MNKKKVVILIIGLLLIGIIVSFLYFGNKKSEEPNNNTLIDNNLQTNDNIQIEKISTYNNPIVPEGFKKVETDFASWKLENGVPKGWNKGLVIEDNIGNQFVWVPIDLENLHYDSYYLSVREQYKKESLNIQNNEDIQILKYGGFYVARYEAGVPKEKQNNLENISVNTNNVIGVPVSKKGSIPWNYIDAENAEKSAKSMYNLSHLKSGLLTNKQWEGIMQWLNGCNYNVYENSSEWGNHSDVNFEFSGYYSTDHGKNYQYGKEKMKREYNMILSCGATDRNMANNIYDLAGNLREYVTGNSNSNYEAAGGYYDNIHQSAYGSGGYSQASNQIGFRVVLSII